MATLPAPSTRARCHGREEEPWLMHPGFLSAKLSHSQLHFTSGMEVLGSILLVFILPTPYPLSCL